MIYFDTAATSLYKPASVESAMREALRRCASPGRGAYKSAMLAADKVFKCRERAAALFNAPGPENVVFTMNATHALNIAINSLVKQGSRVVMSGFEHNSAARPVYARTENYTIAGRRLFDSADTLTSFERALKGADCCVCTYVSNAFGYILPIYEIAELCKINSVPLIVDASQAAGVLPVDMQRLDAAFVAMPGHKALMGPQGTGILLCRALAEPLMYGGSGSDSRSRSMPELLPDAFEAGTHNVCGIAGLNEGLKFIQKTGTERLFRHETALLSALVSELSALEELELFYDGEGRQSGVLSLRCEKYEPESLASLLSERGISVRAGLHCAPLAHESAGTIATGTVRISFSPYNSLAQVKALSGTVKELCQISGK